MKTLLAVLLISIIPFCALGQEIESHASEDRPQDSYQSLAETREAIHAHIARYLSQKYTATTTEVISYEIFKVELLDLVEKYRTHLLDSYAQTSTRINAVLESLADIEGTESVIAEVSSAQQALESFLQNYDVSLLQQQSVVEIKDMLAADRQTLVRLIINLRRALIIASQQ